MTKPPLVSIAIPAYNHAQFIAACLASVCAQTYPELELVLIDDGSTDNTFETAKSFLEPYRTRFRRIVLERRKNQGVSSNSNACIGACQGEWVHLLGSDDTIYPNKVKRIQEAIEELNCPDLVLVHADCDYIDEGGGVIVRRNLKPRPDSGLDRRAFRPLFLGEHYIFNPTVALHRETFLAVGGFDRNLPLEDLDCWLRLSVNHAIFRVPDVLASYRKHPGNSLRRRIRMLAALFKTYGKFLASYPGMIADSDLRIHFRRNVWRFWRRARKEQPLLLISVIVAVARSYWKLPNHTDYQRFAELLDRLPAA